MSANHVPAEPPSQNGLTFEHDVDVVDGVVTTYGGVVLDGFDAPTTSTGVEDRAGATLALQLYGTQAVAVIPEPGTVLLVGVGLAGAGLAAPAAPAADCLTGSLTAPPDATASRFQRPPLLTRASRPTPS